MHLSVIARELWPFVIVSLFLFNGCDEGGSNDSNPYGDGQYASDDYGSNGSNPATTSRVTSGTVAVVPFEGSGTGISSLPITAEVNTEQCELDDRTAFSSDRSSREEYVLSCFYSEKDLKTPAATIERVVELAEDDVVVHIRLTFDPDFVDNSFGDQSIGWHASKKGMHKFKDLVGSDHAEFMLTDAKGERVLHFKVDYISEDPEQDSGYRSLGVEGGNGKMIVGDASSIVAAITSLDRNLNACGFSEYTQDSPSTDETYSPNPETPEWDYRVVYEVWVDIDAFGNAGFGDASIEFVHASPSKLGKNTVEVKKKPCPPDITTDKIPREPDAGVGDAEIVI